ncbi:MAG: tetratricopeptide repeat protein [Dehalococcoidales bacterium]|nr:tetratricopeptide repeat protein [Dehalococcoidales bacterium]
MNRWWSIITPFVAVMLLVGCARPSAGELGEQGIELERAGQTDQAIEKYSEAIEQQPDSLGFRLMRINAYMAKEDYDSAIKDYTEIIRLFPEQQGARAYFDRGKVYEAKGDLEQAMADFEKAIGMSSDENFTGKVQRELERARQ